MRAPYQAYRMLMVREAYADDAARPCDECGGVLGWVPPVVVARAPMRRPEQRYFHLDCYYGYWRWPQLLRSGDAKTLLRWVSDLVRLVEKLRLDVQHPRLCRVHKLHALAARWDVQSGGAV